MNGIYTRMNSATKYVLAGLFIFGHVQSEAADGLASPMAISTRELLRTIGSRDQTIKNGFNAYRSSVSTLWGINVLGGVGVIAGMAYGAKKLYDFMQVPRVSALNWAIRDLRSQVADAEALADTKSNAWSWVRSQIMTMVGAAGVGVLYNVASYYVPIADIFSSRPSLAWFIATQTNFEQVAVQSHKLFVQSMEQPQNDRDAEELEQKESQRIMLAACYGPEMGANLVREAKKITGAVMQRASTERDGMKAYGIATQANALNVKITHFSEIITAFAGYKNLDERAAHVYLLEGPFQDLVNAIEGAKDWVDR